MFDRDSVGELQAVFQASGRRRAERGIPERPIAPFTVEIVITDAPADSERARLRVTSGNLELHHGRGPADVSAFMSSDVAAYVLASDDPMAPWNAFGDGRIHLEGDVELLGNNFDPFVEVLDGAMRDDLRPAVERARGRANGRGRSTAGQ